MFKSNMPNIITTIITTKPHIISTPPHTESPTLTLFYAQILFVFSFHSFLILFVRVRVYMAVLMVFFTVYINFLIFFSYSCLQWRAKYMLFSSSYCVKGNSVTTRTIANNLSLNAATRTICKQPKEEGLIT